MGIMATETTTTMMLSNNNHRTSSCLSCEGDDRNSNYSQSLWLYKSDEDDAWERFHPDHNKALVHAQAVRHTGVILEQASKMYYIDLERQVQTNVETGQQRPLRFVRSGYTWLVSNLAISQPVPRIHQVEKDQRSPPPPSWEPYFTAQDMVELEATLFSGGQDCVILQREPNESLYVDLVKWTLTNLFTCMTYSIKPMEPNPMMSLKKEGKKGQLKQDQEQHQQEPEECKMPQGIAVCKDDCSHTEVEEEEDDAPIILWQWRNEYGLWTCYDDNVTAAIEQAYLEGDSGLVVQPAATTASYLVDFQDMSQTNMISGISRSVQREEA